MERYKELKPLGKGSFGQVFLVAERSGLRRQWVMKRIALQGLSSKELAASHQEVKLLQSLRHPYICSYYESFTDRPTNTLCIVMTFCAGGDLHSRLKRLAKRGEVLREEQIVRWTLQMALALQYIHERHSIIHRDLKTQNVFLMLDDSCKLGDFGVSRILDSPTDMARTCVGTPFYMCPELMRKQHYTSKVDMWALGCVIYELATLRHAFDAKDMQRLAMKIVRGTYPPLAPRYSQSLRDTVDQLLRTSADARPSAAELLSRPLLKAALLKMPPPEGTLSSSPAIPEGGHAPSITKGRHDPPPANTARDAGGAQRRITPTTRPPAPAVAPHLPQDPGAVAAAQPSHTPAAAPPGSILSRPGAGRQASHPARAPAASPCISASPYSGAVRGSGAEGAPQVGGRAAAGTRAGGGGRRGGGEERGGGGGGLARRANKVSAAPLDALKERLHVQLAALEEQRESLQQKRARLQSGMRAPLKPQFAPAARGGGESADSGEPLSKNSPAIKDSQATSSGSAPKNSPVASKEHPPKGRSSAIPPARGAPNWPGKITAGEGRAAGGGAAVARLAAAEDASRPGAMERPKSGRPSRPLLASPPPVHPASEAAAVREEVCEFEARLQRQQARQHRGAAGVAGVGGRGAACFASPQQLSELSPPEPPAPLAKQHIVCNSEQWVISGPGQRINSGAEQRHVSVFAREKARLRAAQEAKRAEELQDQMQLFLSDAKARLTGAAEAQRILEGAQAQADAEAAFYREHLMREKQRRPGVLAEAAGGATAGAGMGGTQQPASQQSASQQSASQQPASQHSNPMRATKTFTAAPQPPRRGKLPAAFSVVIPGAIADPPAGTSDDVGDDLRAPRSVATGPVGAGAISGKTRLDDIEVMGDEIGGAGEETQAVCDEAEDAGGRAEGDEAEGAGGGAAGVGGGGKGAIEDAEAEAERLVAEEAAAMGVDADVEAAVLEKAKEARMKGRTADDLLGQRSDAPMSQHEFASHLAAAHASGRSGFGWSNHGMRGGAQEIVPASVDAAPRAAVPPTAPPIALAAPPAAEGEGKEGADWGEAEEGAQDDGDGAGEEVYFGDASQLQELEDCESTLAAAELHIQLLRATLTPPPPGTARLLLAEMRRLEAEEEMDKDSPLVSSAHLRGDEYFGHDRHRDGYLENTQFRDEYFRRSFAAVEAAAAEEAGLLSGGQEGEGEEEDGGGDSDGEVGGGSDGDRDGDGEEVMNGEEEEAGDGEEQRQRQGESDTGAARQHGLGEARSGPGAPPPAPRSAMASAPRIPLSPVGIPSPCCSTDAALTLSLPPSRFTDDPDERRRAATQSRTAIDHAARAVAARQIDELPPEAQARAQADGSRGGGQTTQPRAGGGDGGRRGEQWQCATEDSPLRHSQRGDRASTLRTLCEQELGADLFAQVYALLRSRQEGELFAADYDAQMRDELRMLMGTAKLRFWPLVDQLIFCEDVEEDAELQPTLWPDPLADANRPTEEDQPTGLEHRRQTSRPCFPFCLAMLPFVLVTTTAWLANPNVYATQHACARVSCDLRMSEAAAKAAWLAKNAPAWGPPRRSSTPAQPIAVPAPAPVAPRPAFATSASTTTREEEAKRAWLAKNKPAWGPPAATRAAQTSLSPPTASARLTEEEAKRAWLARNKPAWGPPAKTREAPNLQAPIGQSLSPPFVHAPLSFFALDRLTPKGSRRSQGGKVDIGDPHDFTRPLCEDSWNGAEVGSWACTPGGWESPKLRPTTETFLVLSGKGAVTDADGAAHPFGPGDVVVLPKHWCGRWDITEHLHKLWVVHDHPDVAGAAYGTVRAMVAPVPTSTLPVIQGPLHKVPANPPANVARTIYDVGPTRVGFLSCAPGSFAIAARPAAECLFVVDGVFFLTNADGSARRCTAGDTVVLPQGWAGGWDIVEPTSKVWVEVA